MVLNQINLGRSEPPPLADDSDEESSGGSQDGASSFVASNISGMSDVTSHVSHLYDGDWRGLQRVWETSLYDE